MNERAKNSHHTKEQNQEIPKTSKPLAGDPWIKKTAKTGWQKMKLFTDKQKRQAWERLINDRKPVGDAYLVHSMATEHQNLKQWRKFRPDMAYQVEIVYRLVHRGMITTKTQFDKAAEVMLTKGAPKHD